VYRVLLRSLLLTLLPLVTLLAAFPAAALESVRVTADSEAIDLGPAIVHYGTESDRISISTAAGPDGIVRRIEVRARQAGSRPDWIAFALRNDSDTQIDRVLVLPHYRLSGSGVIWPDLGATRVTAITASQGLRPEREDSSDADTFTITLDPGATVTFVAELATPRIPQIYLWEPEALKEKINSLTFYRGIVLGIAGLLAMFLTIIFVIKGAVIFPAAAALAWAVLAYLGIEFGFWSRVFAISLEGERLYRAIAEASLGATLLVFLFAYLNLNRWHVRYSHVTGVWLVGLLALVALALINAPIAAGVARLSIAAIAGIGFLLILALAAQGYDRAIMLIPTWFLLLVWVIAAGFTVTGFLTSDIVAPALIGGLVLIVMLIGFTVTQHAFSGGSIAHGLIGDTERKALALVGSGESIFDWDVTADHLTVSPELEATLGLAPGTLEGPASGWFEHIHPVDSDRYRATLDAAIEQRRGRINQDFRFRSADGHIYWFQLKARPVVGDDAEVIRVVGTLTDVTEQRTGEERLLHDAVHDNLTGLPNRELFLDRLGAALRFASADDAIRPTVLVIDLDRFKQVNDSVGLTIGDSVLLTIARRLGRVLRPQDTLARLSGDSFTMILLSETDPERITALADNIRRIVSAPMNFAEREVYLTASIGIALYEPQGDLRAEDFLKNAEVAMVHAKRLGGDKLNVFRPTMRSQRNDRLTLESDLRRAMERGEMKVLFQPIVRLEDRTIAGFEAVLRWDHPRLGRLTPADFNVAAEETGLVVELGLHMLDRAARELKLWQNTLVVDPPIFASVGISSPQMLRHDLLNDVKHVLSRHPVARGSLKLELTESLVMENPEYAAQMLTRVHELGAGVALDDFGTGHSSLAYLERFPFDTIKIDQSFVRPNGNGTRPLILRSLVTLAHDLGMRVVAEGAETESDTVELYQLGCEYAQGYAFGDPMTVIEARKLIGVTTSEAA